MNRIATGDRFLTKVDTYRPFPATWSGQEVDLMHTVTAISADGIETVDHLGATHVMGTKPHGPMDFGRNGRLQRSLAWYGSIPNGTFEEIKILADALIEKRGYREHPYLLLVDTVTDGRAACRIIHAADAGHRPADVRDIPDGATPQEVETILSGSVPIQGEAHGAVFLPRERIFVTTPDRLETGDMIVASGIALAPEKPITILSGEIEVVAHGMTADTLGSWMPATQSEPGIMHARSPLGLGLIDDLELELDRAFAKTQPNEILMLVSPSGDDVRMHSLSTSGQAFFDVDAIEDHFYGVGLEPGLWLGFDAAWYNAGDDGAEIECSWRAATVDDLERHRVGLDEVAEWISEHREADASSDDALMLIAATAATEAAAAAE